ncbi:hypothetical protein D3C87_626350 [compost metagenome]
MTTTEQEREPPYIKICIGPPSLRVPNGYLSAHASFPSEAGEVWRRSCDLADGEMTAQPVDKICAAIKEMLGA